MARPSFPVLPTGQARDPRRMAQVINNTLAGKTNNVEDATIPDTTASPYTISDVRVSTWSAVILIPTNASARTLAASGLMVTAADASFDVTYTGTPSGDATFRYVVVS